ncbi:MAG: DUF4384 domain-containing protein [Candidatus Eisenbacteria bacterium]|nr:DUF4384 domain-containing protein [Candidatus Eisenbacteria bacterium]
MIRTHRWMVGALLALAVLVVSGPASARGRALGVEVWTDRGDDAVYEPGEALQVKVRTTDDAYLLVYEIDADGRISVLYPWRRSAVVVDGRRTYRLPEEGSRYELVMDKTVGQGFLVAIASREPFRDLPWYLRPFDPQGESIGYEDAHAEEEGFDENGAVVGDPMVAMERIRRRVLASTSDPDLFATSYASYYVGHEVRYPRYLCSDCHRSGQWAWWDGFDPYYSQCSVFDFRVNWNWAWGPTMWSGHVPYYYYVVRHDCPPHWQPWYDDHSRWSSWDGHRDRENLWGGPPTRYKTPPPPGYVPPSEKPWNPALSPPPGYIAPSGGKYSDTRPMPVGRVTRPDGTGKPVLNGGGKGTATPVGKPAREVAPAPRKPYNPAQGGSSGDRGRSKPDYSPPPREQGGERSKPQQPSSPPPAREERRSEPPRVDPPKKEERRADPAPAPPAPAPSRPSKSSEGKGSNRGGN